MLRLAATALLSAELAQHRCAQIDQIDPALLRRLTDYREQDLSFLKGGITQRFAALCSPKMARKARQKFGKLAALNR